MDAVTLDGILRELRPALVGKHLGRARIVGAHSIAFEIAADRARRRVWLEAGRGIAGPYLLDRETERRLSELAGGEGAAAGRTRQCLLLMRKHLSGRRIADVRRIAGERHLVVDAGEARLGFRLSGSAPALTLVVGGTELGTMGEGSAAWPPPDPAPEREWDAIEARIVARALDERGDQSSVRAVLRVVPSLGPVLASELDRTSASFDALRARLQDPRPTLVGPGPVSDWTDAELASERAVTFLPCAPAVVTGAVNHPRDWTAAAALFLNARLRGRRFAERQRRLLEGARSTLRRLSRLEAHLVEDRRSLPDPDVLRREGHALLAALLQAAPGADSVTIPDPYAPGKAIEVRLDPSLSVPRNADRLFDKARRIERAGRKVDDRLQTTRLEIERARRTEEAVARARHLGELSSDPDEAPAVAQAAAATGRRRYLTSRGLTLLVGRGATDNHRLTFGEARPEDFWLHARDVPGAHVILRDDGGRVGPDDIREAAEVAAFLSGKSRDARVDVHVARRKHLRSAPGGPGRASVAQSETLRVEPRDPEGRLRRR